MHRHVDFSGNPAISKVVASLKIYNADGYKEVVPFIDEKGDVSPFQEVRTTSTVDIGQAVWILTTKLGSGQISKSFWHRSHRLGILSEWQFTKSTKNKKGIPREFAFIGEHYWRQEVTEQGKRLNVRLPVHQKELMFDTTKLADYSAFHPSRFIDVARYIANVLIDAGEFLEDILPYRLIPGIAQS